jgi:hypothetical protein
MGDPPINDPEKVKTIVIIEQDSDPVPDITTQVNLIIDSIAKTVNIYLSYSNYQSQKSWIHKRSFIQTLLHYLLIT